MISNHIKKFTVSSLAYFFIFSPFYVNAMFSESSASTKKEEKRVDESSTLRAFEELHGIITIGSLRYDVASNPGVSGQCLWNILRHHMADILDRETVLQRAATAAGITFNAAVDNTAGIRTLFRELNRAGYRLGYRLVNISLDHIDDAIEGESFLIDDGPILRLAVIFGEGEDAHYIEAIDSDTKDAQITLPSHLTLPIARNPRTADELDKTIFTGSYISTALANQTTKELRTIVTSDLPESISAQISTIIEKLKPDRFQTAQITSQEIQIRLHKVLQQIEDLRSDSQTETVNILSKLVKQLKREEFKEHILENYPDDLNVLREINLTLPLPEGKNMVIRPDGHFMGPDGKEILVFYNDNLSKLREIIYHGLQHHYGEHNARLWAIGHRFFDTADSTDPDRMNSAENRALGGLKALVSLPIQWFNIVAPSTTEIRNQAYFLARESAFLNKWQQESGSTLDGSSTPFVVYVNRDLSGGGTHHLVDSNYGELERTLYRLSIEEPNLIKRIKVLDTLLNVGLRAYHPDASIMDAVQFNFPFSRIDHYLRQIEEQGLDDKDAETVICVRTFREKINMLSLKYKFITKTEESPILNVRVGRCKIILETNDKKIIFLERTQAKKFIKDVEDKLDTKASNITGQHDFVPMTGSQLRDLVRTLNPESYQAALDNLSAEIVDMQAASDACRAQAVASCAKVALQITDTSGLIKMTLDNSEESQFTDNEVKEYVDVEKRLQETAQISEVETDPLDQLLHFSFDDAEPIIMQPSTSQPQDLGIIHRIDRGFPQREVTNVRQIAENMTKLGQALRRANLKPKDIDSLLSGFQCFLESKRIEGHMKIREGQRSYIQKIKDYQSDFINLFKLYIKLFRLDLKDRLDYYGILIEEFKSETSDGRGKTMREYKVTEVKNLEDIVYDD